METNALVMTVVLMLISVPMVLLVMVAVLADTRTISPNAVKKPAIYAKLNLYQRTRRDATTKKALKTCLY